MTWHVKIEAANGSVHETDLPDDWMPAGDQPPTALEVAAKFTAEMAEEHRSWGLDSTFAYRPPLTIRIEEED